MAYKSNPIPCSDSGFQGLNVFQREDTVFAVTDSRNDPTVKTGSRREFLARFPNNMDSTAKALTMKALRYVYLNHRNQSVPEEVVNKDDGIRIAVKLVPSHICKDLINGIIRIGPMGRKIYEVQVLS